MQLRACHYDDHSDILTVVDSDGIIRYDCCEIENLMDMYTTARSRLRWLKSLGKF